VVGKAMPRRCKAARWAHGDRMSGRAGEYMMNLDVQMLDLDD
jgi:hypothetical protein